MRSTNYIFWESLNLEKIWVEETFIVITKLESQMARIIVSKIDFVHDLILI